MNTHRRRLEFGNLVALTRYFADAGLSADLPLSSVYPRDSAECQEGDANVEPEVQVCEAVCTDCRTARYPRKPAELCACLPSLRQREVRESCRHVDILFVTFSADGSFTQGKARVGVTKDFEGPFSASPTLNFATRQSFCRIFKIYEIGMLEKIENDRKRLFEASCKNWKEDREGRWVGSQERKRTPHRQVISTHSLCLDLAQEHGRPRHGSRGAEGRAARGPRSAAGAPS